MPVKYTKVHRLMQIITLVQTQRGWTAEALAKEFNTAERTIFRDIKQIKELGIPIETDGGSKGYTINGTYFMPPVRLTIEEALAMSALCETLADSGAIPFIRPASMAIHKIQSQLPLAVREELTERLQTMQLRTTPTMDEEGYGDIYDTAQRALLKKKIIECKYESIGSGNDDEVFLFHPYALFFGKRAWYIVGFHENRDAIRTLKLSRFLKMEITNHSTEVPPSFTLEKHLGNAWQMIPGPKDFEVEIKFDHPFSFTISDTQWHATQDIEWHDDESCTFRCTVSGLDEIVWWILGMGPSCKVIKPPELVDKVSSLTKEMAERYA
ncbi:MAG: YafY family transcriptional regulator [Phycisphaerae bacterium]|jgi:predicted DNA-binding transcriptional regulator YafY|nr:YafY family transcriptional regulator [Phycisphaerae bacterium]